MAQEQMILPKGIVLNTDSIYEEIAKFDIIPVERILRACHVFTTTSRTLDDPTARRLENFWTRVLGGNRRYLSGRVLARLFKEISDETSFVKLRGPQNRYEPPPPESAASKQQNVEATSSVPTSKPKDKSATPSAKLPHPILKKPRGPSASGPRPTARFVSPPGSGISKNEEKPSGATSSTTTVCHINHAKDSDTSTTREEKKKGLIQKSKKTTAFIASTSSRRRPGLPRKSSSQASGGSSDTVSKGDLSTGAKVDGSQDLVPTALERPGQQLTGTKKVKGSPGLSAKAAGKRPATQPQSEKSTSKSKPTRDSQAGEISKAVLNPTKTDHKSSLDRSDSRGKVKRPTEWSKSSAITIQSNDTQDLYAESSRPMNRSASDTGPIRSASREVGRIQIPPSSLMASTLAKLDTSVIGRGTISGFSESVPTQETSIGGLQGASGSRRASEGTSQSPSSSGVYQQFTPTAPSNTVPIPLGRTRSQLSVLLDRKPDNKSKRR
ncbi:hypothetical protein GGS21DRAFT_417331 [Xylaria nigripes]|nr:hypothetical protein GGS21DRAFT_417331 [Xylaria nigripes]